MFSTNIFFPTARLGKQNTIKTVVAGEINMLGHKNLVFNEYFPLSKILFECAVSKNRGGSHIIQNTFFGGALILVELLKGVRLHASPSYSTPFPRRGRVGQGGMKPKTPSKPKGDTENCSIDLKTSNWMLSFSLLSC